MLPAPEPENEAARLAALEACSILDTEADPLFDGITALAAGICEVPIALVTLVDRKRQWFKSAHGLGQVRETPREVAFCAHVILGDDVLEVPDALYDIRFFDNPLVQAEPRIRFYAGIPLQDARGHGLGTLCVIDRVPRCLSEAQRAALGRLADLVMALLEQRKGARQLAERELRQSLVAQFGQRALADPDPDALMQEAVQMLSGTLGFEYCRILERSADGQNLILRAATGWPNAAVNDALKADESSTLAARILTQPLPPLVDHVHVTGNGERSAWAARQDFASGLEIAVPGPHGPFGLLGLHSRDSRPATADVTSFAQSIANIVGTAIARRQAQEKLVYMQQFDALTGLPNRHLFRDRVAQALVLAQKSTRPICLMVLDLDAFNAVNSLHGHQQGDALLVGAARRLQSILGAGDTLSRIGADEFGVLFTDLANADDAARNVQRALDVLAAPFPLADGEVFLSASAGVSLFDADGRDAETLERNAELALYRAKEQGYSTCHFYAPAMNRRAQDRVRLEASLRRALAREEFVLHFQPKVQAASGRICGAEALLRWNDPQRGLVPPGEFVGVLEETGLIEPVGLWVLKSVCKQIRLWQGAGLSVPPIAVNLSVRQFRHADLDARLGALLAEAGLQPGQIELEITESMLMENPLAATQMLKRLETLGIRLSIDDFGTGYSSLAYLRQFPVHELKIDRAFISGLDSGETDATIALAIISLAHSLGLEVVAEGVETAAQARFLATHGCDVLQGYHISRPLDASSFGRLLRDPQVLARKLGPTAVLDERAGPARATEVRA